MRELQRVPWSNDPAGLGTEDRDHVGVERLGDHFVVKVPAGALAELRNDRVTLSQELDVEIDMLAGLRADQHFAIVGTRGVERTSREM